MFFGEKILKKHPPMIEMAIVYMYYQVVGVAIFKSLIFRTIYVWMCAELFFYVGRSDVACSTDVKNIKRNIFDYFRQTGP